jgi:hypothetical protein
MSVISKVRLKVADEVWIATALLHREHPDRSDFSLEEIQARVEKEALTGSLRPGVYVHIVQHCVANRAPNPGRYRVLFETGPGRRRLFRKGDAYHPAREGAKVTPRAEDLWNGYDNLLTWYHQWCAGKSRSSTHADPLLSLYGSGRRLWNDERADEYVRRLREGWQ